MNFGMKLQTLRKEKRLSQEALAEKLGVSRQAVSKWETNEGYPEMDKLITLGQLFDVTLDYLIKDDNPQPTLDTQDKYFMSSQKVKEYLNAKKVFGLKIAFAVSAIILSMNMPLIFKDPLGNVGFLIVTGISLMLLIVTGIGNDTNTKLEKNHITMSYHDLQSLQTAYLTFKAKFGIAVALGVFIIIMGLAGVLVLEDWLQYPDYIGSVYFITSVAIAVWIFIVVGIIDVSYQFLLQNDEYIARKKDDEQSLFSITMPLAAMLYLMIGFTKNWWHPGWIIFPVTAILTSGIEYLFKKRN